MQKTQVSKWQKRKSGEIGKSRCRSLKPAVIEAPSLNQYWSQKALNLLSTSRVLKMTYREDRSKTSSMSRTSKELVGLNQESSPEQEAKLMSWPT